ncbi:MAG TPA: imidazole glycerol phosphate synthase subunit HisH [Chromatiales bacterium]|nr:imidazole glycerol phosphate synthase subunit HisH [Thiotrichales bacterium]HIP68129.1 imidazole glycerol phosphate synthase subunit HisH [Chromatiales bacterium]
MKQKIVVVDYGMGNIHSVVTALEYVTDGQAEVLLTSQPELIQKADRIVFPGQGAAKDCMRELQTLGLDQAVLEVAQQKPFLGICMGLQVLMAHSEENDGVDCLGLYPGEVRHFGEVSEKGERLKIPHMGWNNISQTRLHPLWKNIADNSRFYFVHSYYVDPEDAALTVGECEYGLTFTAAIARDNVFALQCHPEKSAAAGLQLLTNFIEWDGTE